MRSIEVAEAGVRGALKCPDETGSHPGVIFLGGSFGGIPHLPAQAIADQGFACLALAYFGVEGLSPVLSEVPIETVEAGIHWLTSRPEVSGSEVVLVGFSKGAELALVAGTLLGDSIRAVVGIVPASVVFSGIDLSNGDGIARSSWAWRGAGLPFAAPAADAALGWTDRGMATRPILESALADTDAVNAAAIPVERIKGKVLLASGGDDQQWPSSEMSDALVARAVRHGRGDQVRRLDYPRAGHMLLPAGIDPPASSPFDLGGDPEANAAARLDLWPRIYAFLHEELATEACIPRSLEQSR